MEGSGQQTRVGHHSMKWVKAAFQYPAVAIMLFIIGGTSAAQSWDYKAFNQSGRYTGSGFITFKEGDGGRGTFRMYVGNDINKCVDGELIAAVVKTPETTIITTEPRVGGCPEMRFVVKNDGSGGYREMKKGGEWAPDGMERGLTLRK